MAPPVRVAVEGCVGHLIHCKYEALLIMCQGHGTLDAIYAGVEESCKVKGWASVDLLIIGGDFQVTQNSQK